MIAAVTASVSGIHGGLRYLFLVGLFMFGGALVFGVGRIVLASLPVHVAERLQPPVRPYRPDARTLREQVQRERGRPLRLAARFIGKEIAGNRMMVQDAVASGYYWSGVTERLSADLWTKNHAVLAEAAGAQDAYRKAMTAYYEFERINRVVRDSESHRPSTLALHRLPEVVQAAEDAEAALTDFDRTLGAAT